ncbi:MAG: hypothetical protein EA361_15555 [Bacteroidetes bacterium]|nr:MAG: hypothetical protein EA361_15555 [Bacteroidota bacterium]
MSLRNLVHIEYLKLFRKSNLLFLFLAVYLFVTPIGRGYDELKIAESLSVDDLFLAMVNSFSVMGLLLLAIFMVNNTGNDFNEGSYRKSLAIGLTRGDYLKGKLLLSGFLCLFVIISTLLLYFVFSIFFLKAGIIEVLQGINFLSLLNQLIALSGAAFFGLFIIMVFRNRTIGLVFFPFWFITEFIVFLIDRSGTQRLFSVYFPGISSYELYTMQVFDVKSMAITLIYATIFLTAAWYGLTLREEKAS